MNPPKWQTLNADALQVHISRKAYRLECLIEAEQDPDAEAFNCTKQAIQEHRKELNAMKAKLAKLQKKQPINITL